MKIHKAKLFFSVEKLCNDGTNYILCPCGFRSGSFYPIAEHLRTIHRYTDSLVLDSDFIDSLSLEVEVYWWSELFVPNASFTRLRAEESLRAAQSALWDLRRTAGSSSPRSMKMKGN